MSIFMHETLAVVFSWTRIANVEKLNEIAAEKVVALIETVSGRAICRNNMHNFWSAVI